jgi:hypothetical protein
VDSRRIVGSGLLIEKAEEDISAIGRLLTNALSAHRRKKNSVGTILAAKLFRMIRSSDAVPWKYLKWYSLRTGFPILSGRQTGSYLFDMIRPTIAQRLSSGYAVIRQQPKSNG